MIKGSHSRTEAKEEVFKLLIVHMTKTISHIKFSVGIFQRHLNGLLIIIKCIYQKDFMGSPIH
jgi:hypothetical protein